MLISLKYTVKILHISLILIIFDRNSKDQMCVWQWKNSERGTKILHFSTFSEYNTESQLDTVLMMEETPEQEDNATSARRVTFRSLDDSDQSQSTLYIGRPIAQICQVTDPVSIS